MTVGTIRESTASIRGAVKYCGNWSETCQAGRSLTFVRARLNTWTISKSWIVQIAQSRSGGWVTDNRWRGILNALKQSYKRLDDIACDISTNVTYTRPTEIFCAFPFGTLTQPIALYSFPRNLQRNASIQRADTNKLHKAPTQSFK